MPDQDADSSFAAAVRKQREASGLSQAELAERAEPYGVKFVATTIYKIETGKRKVTVGEMIALGHALRVSVHELLGGGVDSAYVAKEVLLEFGMETLLDHERIVDSMMPMINRQKAIRQFIADYRDRFGEDPLWLAYKPGSQDLRQHWGPLADWTGPADYLSSWRALVEATGDRYLLDLGWADDRADQIE